MSAAGDLVAGRYRLVVQIGTGGMGRVWQAHDEFLHRDVAMKEVVFPPDLTGPERDEMIQRTLREGRAAGRLSHPNVVAVYDVIRAEGRPWIVMELVRSRSLYQVIREDGPVSPRQTAETGPGGPRRTPRGPQRPVSGIEMSSRATFCWPMMAGWC